MLLQLHVLYATLFTFFVIGLNNMHAQKIRDWIRLHRHAVIVYIKLHTCTFKQASMHKRVVIKFSNFRHWFTLVLTVLVLHTLHTCTTVDSIYTVTDALIELT